MRHRRLALIGISAVLALVVGTAVAQEVTGGFLARGTLSKLDAENDGVEVETKGPTDVVVARFTFEPGSSSGWHHDRGVVLAVVQSGKLQEIDEKCDKRVLRAGDGFFEEGDSHVVRNVGKVNATIRVTFVVPAGTPTDGLIIPDEPRCNVE